MIVNVEKVYIIYHILSLISDIVNYIYEVIDSILFTHIQLKAGIFLNI